MTSFKNSLTERQDEKRVVTGIVMDPKNVDSFGNRIPDQDLIERIAFGFMEKSQRIGTDHAKGADGTTLANISLVIVESFINRNVQRIGNRKDVPVGAWVLSVRVNDDAQWERVVRGDLTGFSLEGVFVRVPIAKKKAA